MLPEKILQLRGSLQRSQVPVSAMQLEDSHFVLRGKMCGERLINIFRVSLVLNRHDA